MRYIILLHGLGPSIAQSLSLLPIKKMLNYYELSPILCLKYNSNDNITIDESIDEISDSLIENNINKELDELILICQSMGGVIGNNLHRVGWNVIFAVYIASPLHGARHLTYLKSIWPRLYSMIHRSAYSILNEKNREEIPPHPYHTITLSWAYGSFDGCVYTDEAILEMEHNTHLNWTDHTFIWIHPRLWFCVKDLILRYLYLNDNSITDK
jgi:hypothetical protein